VFWLASRPAWAGCRREALCLTGQAPGYASEIFGVHNTQPCLRLAGWHVLPIDGSSGDVTWDEADLTCSVEAVECGG
jgi:hypothetical protein